VNEDVDPPSVERSKATETARSAERLLPIVYDELRRLAAWKMAQESAAHTLQPTALVHEAWLRLGGAEQPAWDNRAHFFGAAAEAMRRILVDRARSRGALRRGGGQAPLVFDELALAAPVENDGVMIALDEALAKLAAEDPAKAQLVKLRFFAGMRIDEAAEALGISEPTAKRWWNYARAWLHAEMTAR
jgi:RNA polymerase sigma factor (TIGR02999 family)